MINKRKFQEQRNKHEMTQIDTVTSFTYISYILENIQLCLNFIVTFTLNINNVLTTNCNLQSCIPTYPVNINTPHEIPNPILAITLKYAKGCK